MSNVGVPSSEASQLRTQEVLDRPAIGIVATEETMDNSLVGAIVRSVDNGYHVLVTADGANSEVVGDLIGPYPVTFIDSTERPIDTEPIEHLTQYARQYGFPGLIHHEVLSEPIDYDESVQEVSQSSRYCISAVPITRNGREGQVVAGILAYNEELGIGSVVHAVKEHVDKVYVVNDGSRDNTRRIARQAGARVIDHKRNRGKGAAIQTLLDHIKSEKCQALILLDGDGQHVPSNIPDIVAPIIDGKADLVIGSRYMEDSGRDETPRYRRFGQSVLDLMTFGTSRAQVSDSQSGFRALSPKAIEQLSIKTDGFGAESEMIDSAMSNGLTITERPVEVRYEGVDGHTKNPLKHGLEVVAFLLYLIRDRHPLVFFGIPGIVITVAGVLYGLDGILIYQNTGQFYPAKVLISGFLTIIGVLGMFVGLILNQVSNMINTVEPAR